MVDLEELGVTHDTLLVHPSQARALRQTYAEKRHRRPEEQVGHWTEPADRDVDKQPAWFY